MPGAFASGQSVSGRDCLARAESTLGRQLARAVSARRSSTPTRELERKLGVTHPDDLRDRRRGELPRPRGGDARRARPAHDGHRARDRRRCRDPRRQPRRGCKANGTVVYLHADRRRCASARAGAVIARCSTPRIRWRAPRRALHAARPAVPRGRRRAWSSPSASEIARFARQLETAQRERARRD